MVERKNQHLYLKEVEQIHGNRYDYSKIEYINNKTKICIVCRIHGDFLKRPDSFLKGSGCPRCHYRDKSKHHRKSKSIFVQDLINKFGNELYNYDYIDYINASTKVKILCKKHGWIYKSPKTLLQNSSICHQCTYRDTEEFISICDRIHNNSYDYSNVNYTLISRKVHIICPKHGDFFQEARNHLNGSGCPICKTSKGERQMILYFKEKAIDFKYQITKYYHNTTLIFDFYIPKWDLYIEYDGKHHFQDSLYGTFEKVHHKDLIKDKYITENNLKLLRIHYLDFDKIYNLHDFDISTTINYSRNPYY